MCKNQLVQIRKASYKTINWFHRPYKNGKQTFAKEIQFWFEVFLLGWLLRYLHYKIKKKSKHLMNIFILEKHNFLKSGSVVITIPLQILLSLSLPGFASRGWDCSAWRAKGTGGFYQRVYIPNGANEDKRAWLFSGMPSDRTWGTGPTSNPMKSNMSARENFLVWG